MRADLSLRSGTWARHWRAIVCCGLFTTAALAQVPPEFERELAGRDAWGQWTYTGDRSLGQADGKGVVVWAGGNRFEGTFKAGVGPVRGLLRYSDGGTYEGKVSPTYGREGDGTYTSPTSKCVLTGNWRDGRLQGKGRTVCPDREVDGEYSAGLLDGKAYLKWSTGETFDGFFRKGKRHGESVIRRPNGSVEMSNWRDGQRQGLASYVNGAGQRYNQFYERDQLLMSIPVGNPASVSAECRRHVPRGWIYLAGGCSASGLNGDVDLVHEDGKRRSRGHYTDEGTPANNILYGRLPVTHTGALVRLRGLPATLEDYIWARVYRLQFDAQGKATWVVRYDGDMEGLEPQGTGSCEVPGKGMEDCEWRAGKRVDAVALARDAERARQQREDEREERRKERLARQCERMCPDARERSECEDEDREPASCTPARSSVQSAGATTGNNDALQYYQQLMANVNSVREIHSSGMQQFNNLVAQRQQQEAEQRLAAQRAQREREAAAAQLQQEQARRQQQAQQVAVAEAQRRQEQAEREHRQRQREEEARRQEEERRRQEAEQQARRQLEAQQAQARQREQEAIKLAEAQAKLKAEEDYLRQLAAGTRVDVINCFGSQSVVAKFPDLGKKVVGCVDLEIKAWCANASAQFPFRGVWKNVNGFGAGCFDDTFQIEPRLACDVKQINVEVERAVPGCKFR